MSCEPGPGVLSQTDPRISAAMRQGNGGCVRTEQDSGISAKEEPSRNPHFATAQTRKLLNCSEDERLISALAFRSDRT